MSHVKFTLNGVPVQGSGSFKDILKSMGAGDDRRVLAVRSGGVTLPLTASPSDGDVVTTLTYADAEGRRVYERSLRFVLLLAVKQLMPDAKVRLEHSFGHGIYINLFGSSPLSARAVAALEARMRELVARDLPFEETIMSKQEAIQHFRDAGQMDKVRLLKHRQSDTFRMYHCGGYSEYFYGIMAPSTGYVGVFALNLYLPGMMLQLPAPENPAVAAPPRDLPKLMQTYVESAKWASILECSNTADLNALTATGGIRKFIQVNEALHERAINNIADEFIRSGARVILIAGPSSSGKTTFANRLSIALRVLGLKPMSLSLDNYYIDRDKIPPGEDGEIDLERLDTLDVNLFNDHLVRLLQGEKVATPVFDFKSSKRSESVEIIHVGSDQPILIEGIHGLNDALTEDVARNLKFKIYVSALTTLNLDDHNRIRTTDARLLRRMVRDNHFRGTTPEETMAMWPSVKRGEENYIFPFQEEADIMFNSSLVYEMAVLKDYIYPHLKAVKPESVHFALAERLIKFLNYFLSAAGAEEEIPPNSILREFIGGSCFYR